MQDIVAPLPQLLTARQGGTVTKYLRGLGLIGEQQGGAWQYPLPDALGSVRQLVDAQGQVQVANRFDPFGGLESVAGQGRSAYGFAGEEQADSGHLFLRARTYNPETGRFLQQDSVLGDPMQPRSLHRYAYGFSNPVNYTDPSGLMPDLGSRYSGRGGNSAAARAGGYAVRVETQVSPQAQYTAQVRRLGYNSSYLGSPNNGGIPRVSVARSVNGPAGQNWQTGSDPYARSQSQGYRPAPCGPMKHSPLDPLFAIRDTGQWIIDGVKADIEAMKADPAGYNRKRAEDWFNWTVDGVQKGWDIFKRDTARLKQDLQNDLHHSLQTLRQDPARFARETAAATRRMWQQSRETLSLTLDVIPVVGDVKGLVEGLVGTDLTGNEIGQHMRAVMVLAAIVGFFTFADEALAAGRLVDHLTSNADLAVDLLKSSKGLGHLDEGAGLVKHLDDGLLKQLPEASDGLRSLRSLDEADEFMRSGVSNRLRNRMSIDAEISSSSSNVHHPNFFEQHPDLDEDAFNKHIVETLRSTSNKAPDTEVSRIAQKLADKIEAGEIKVRYLDPFDFKIRTGDNYIETAGVAKLDTNEILISKYNPQFTESSDVLQTIFHEGVHIDDIDNARIIDREMLAWTRTIEFAEINGLNHRFLELYQKGGDEALRREVRDLYWMGPNGESEFKHYNPDAIRRKLRVKDGLSSEAEIEAGLRHWVEENVIPEYHRRLLPYEEVLPGYLDDVNRFKGQFGKDELALDVYIEFLERHRK